MNIAHGDGEHDAQGVFYKRDSSVLQGQGCYAQMKNPSVSSKVIGGQVKVSDAFL